MTKEGRLIVNHNRSWFPFSKGFGSGNYNVRIRDNGEIDIGKRDYGDKDCIIDMVGEVNDKSLRTLYQVLQTLPEEIRMRAIKSNDSELANFTEGHLFCDRWADKYNLPYKRAA